MAAKRSEAVFNRMIKEVREKQGNPPFERASMFVEAWVRLDSGELKCVRGFPIGRQYQELVYPPKSYRADQVESFRVYFAV